MMKITGNVLVADDAEGVELLPKLTRARGAGQMSEIKTLIIRAARFPSLESYRNYYDNADLLQVAHLAIGREGDQILQVLPFHQRVGSSWKFNRTAITLNLINPGQIQDQVQYKNLFFHEDNNPADRCLLSFGKNDFKFRTWGSFPVGQLDRLLEICTLLIESKDYGISEVVTYEDLDGSSLIPGPAFPKVAFFEALKAKFKDLKVSGRILEKIAQSTDLVNSPESGVRVGHLDLGNEAGGVDVAVVDERPGWSLVEVVSDRDGFRWQKGWVEAEKVELKDFTPIVEKGKFLFAMDENNNTRPFTYIPAADGNFNPREGSNQPKYIIMHFTTGTRIQQTLNHFTSPEGGASTHLVIGRDGRIYQCVPFDHAAQHSGFSYWENQKNLNNVTIGIELDNAGYLRQLNDGRFARKDTIIPTERVAYKRHIKDYVPKYWEIFPEKQVEVAKKVVKALKEAFGIEDVIGHDQVNLKFRSDPGPCFEEHIQAMRMELFQRPGSKNERYQTVMRRKTQMDDKDQNCFEQITVFTDYMGLMPLIPYPLVEGAILEANQPINVLEDHGPWKKVRIRNRWEGWLASEHIVSFNEGTRFKLKDNTGTLYKVLSSSKVGLPPTELQQLDPWHRNIRIQWHPKGANMALIATPIRMPDQDGEKRERLIEGWVKWEDLELEADLLKPDGIRRFVSEVLIDPARCKNQEKIVLVARDIHAAMDSETEISDICSALDTQIFLKEARVKELRREGLARGADALWEFEILA